MNRGIGILILMMVRGGGRLRGIMRGRGWMVWVSLRGDLCGKDGG